MKILQTRAAAERILLVTTCHNMNLLAVITRSLVVVYRSTTLTVVTTLSLTPCRGADRRAYKDYAVCACWSPSGRILAVGLACGELFLLDVEGGDLVRRFVPRNHASVLHGGNTENEWVSAYSEDVNGLGDGDGDSDSAVNPLRRPVILSISITEALIACAWATAPLDELSAKLPNASATCHSSTQSGSLSAGGSSESASSDESGGGRAGASVFPAASLCLAPSAGATSPVLEEAEQSRGPVLVLLDARGALCLISGGLQEVAVVAIVAQLPCALDPFRVSVESFTIAASHTASLVLRPRDGKGPVMRAQMNLRACIAAAGSRETIALCCVAERCRVAAAARVDAQKEWAAALRRARSHFCVDAHGNDASSFFVALRDALVEVLAQPSAAVCFTALNASALTAAAADVPLAFARMARRLTCAGQRSHDTALHTALESQANRRQRLALADAISAARRRADFFLRRARRDCLRERELLLWAAQRAQPGAASVAASRHPSLLRTVHRALRPAQPGRGGRGRTEREAETEAEAAEEARAAGAVGAAGAGAEAEEREDAAADRALARVLDECLRPCGDAAAAAAVTVRASEVPREGLAAGIDGAEQAAVRWSGAVGEEGRRAVLWERGGGGGGGLAVAIVGEDGKIAEIEDGNEEEENEEEREPAVLEIKGLAPQHVRASVSRARGFGVFYAEERFVVIDFYDS